MNSSRGHTSEIKTECEGGEKKAFCSLSEEYSSLLQNKPSLLNRSQSELFKPHCKFMVLGKKSQNITAKIR